MTKQSDNHVLQFHEDGTFHLKLLGSNAGRIWTFYDKQERKHWLTVQRGELVGRYMLQDNQRPAWHSDRKSLPERVSDAVQEMIVKLEQDDASNNHTAPTT